MKTAEEYWKTHMTPHAFGEFKNYSKTGKVAIEGLVAAIAADARADARAEAKAKTDPDEERAKAEWDRLQQFFPEDERVRHEVITDMRKSAWRAYVKTLPPRPVRSPGQVLADALREVDFMSGKLSECAEAKFERAATALGIKAQE